MTACAALVMQCLLQHAPYRRCISDSSRSVDMAINDLFSFVQVTYDVEKTEKGAQAANVRDADGKPFERPVQAREGGERRQGGNGGGDRRPRSPRGPRAPREE